MMGSLLLACSEVSGTSLGAAPRERTGCTAEPLEQCASQTVEGIDVFDGQGVIDWPSVAGAGIGFAIAKGLARHAYYFVPLTIADEEEVLIAPSYTVDLGDRAVCHRNVEFESAEITFISTRLMQDRFALAFEFFINIGHAFVDGAGPGADKTNTALADVFWALLNSPEFRLNH